MATATLVSPEEYLSTSYEDGDREYVDGLVVERNVGEIDHSDTQGNAYYYLKTFYKDKLWVGPEVRVQVKQTRFRVPDVTVVLGGKPSGRIVTTAPFIVIEVLSREDRASDLLEKIQDYIEFGIANVWVLNPRTQTAMAYTRNGVVSVTEGMLRTTNPEIAVPLSELF